MRKINDLHAFMNFLWTAVAIERYGKIISRRVKYGADIEITVGEGSDMKILSGKKLFEERVGLI